MNLAEGALNYAVTDERRLRDHLAAIASHQKQRQRVFNDSRPLHQHLESVFAEIDAAIDHTRPERVRSDTGRRLPQGWRRLGEDLDVAVDADPL